MQGLIEKFVFDFNLAFIVIHSAADSIKVKRTHEKLDGMSLRASCTSDETWLRIAVLRFVKFSNFNIRLQIAFEN